MESENKSGNPAPVIYLQKLTDIHLFSHKSREIENNGEIRSIVLLVSGTIIIIFIALINFFNLSRVQFISRLKSIKVKLINGASREILAGETALESLLLSALSILVGLVIAISLSRHLGISILDPDRIVLVFLVALGFIFSHSASLCITAFYFKNCQRHKSYQSPGEPVHLPASDPVSHWL